MEFIYELKCVTFSVIESVILFLFIVSAISGLFNKSLPIHKS